MSSSPAAQVNTTPSSTPATNTTQNPAPVHCSFPFAAVLFPDCAAYAAGQALGNAAGSAATAVTQGTANTLAQAFANSIISLIDQPFKALGLNGLADAMWRLLLIGVGIMVLAFGLMIFAGTAIKEEAGSPQAQEAGQAAALAA